MAHLTLAELQTLRDLRYRRIPKLQFETEEEALQFIDERGFVLLINSKALELPSLWRATRRRGQAWPWKQTLSGAKHCAYGKLLCRKGTFVSWEYLPHFLAVYSNTNSYLKEYRAGRLSRVERQILEILEERGPLLTRELRRTIGLSGRTGTRRFHWALDNLQACLRITVAGGLTTGFSMHRWELVDDWVPREILKRGWRMSPDRAKEELTLKYLEAVIVSTPKEIARIFRWNPEEMEALVRRLEGQGLLETGVEVEGLKGRFIARL